jgi:O-antigen/teichoic acid export membrane protein
LLPAIIVFVYGQRYKEAIPIIQILLVAMTFSVTMGVSSNVLYAIDKQASLLRYMVLVAALNIALDFWLIPRYGAMGAAVANGASRVVAAAGMLVILRRSLPGSFPARTSAKIYCAALVSTVPIVYMGLFLHATSYALVLSILLAALSYGACLAVFRVLTKGEFAALRENYAIYRTRRAAER